MDWEKLKSFFFVAQEASLSKAAERLELNQSSLTRQIQSLEKQLGFKLFLRHARGVRLTDKGQVLFETTKVIYEKIARTEHILKQEGEKPSGLLKVLTTVAFGSIWLIPKIKKFLEQYPEMNVDIIATDQKIDQMIDSFDCGISFGSMSHSKMINKRILVGGSYVCGTESYFQEKGDIFSLQDLENHNLIAYKSFDRPPFENLDWLLHAGCDPGQERETKFSINSTYGVYKSISSGLGVGVIPKYLIEDHPNYKTVLTDYIGPQPDIFLVYHKDFKENARVQAFENFLMNYSNINH